MMHTLPSAALGWISGTLHCHPPQAITRSDCEEGEQKGALFFFLWQTTFCTGRADRTYLGVYTGMLQHWSGGAFEYHGRKCPLHKGEYKLLSIFIERRLIKFVTGGCLRKGYPM